MIPGLAPGKQARLNLRCVKREDLESTTRWAF